jgi:hypothetical protein
MLFWLSFRVKRETCFLPFSPPLARALSAVGFNRMNSQVTP